MTPTVRMRDSVEAVGYQFLRDDAGWALYDLDSVDDFVGGGEAGSDASFLD